MDLPLVKVIISTALLPKKNEQGDYVIHLGGDKNQDNYLDIYPGWNAAIRIYSPTKAYFDGSWTPPQFQPAR